MSDDKLVHRKVEEGASPDDLWTPSAAWRSSHSVVGDQYILGFGYHGVRPGETLNVLGQARRMFRPNRLVIPSDIAVNFMVVDLKIGKNSQFNSPEAIPAALFGENALGVRFRSDICFLAMDAIVTVRNFSSQIREFTCALVGQVVE